jgi:hypothetical protein
MKIPEVNRSLERLSAFVYNKGLLIWCIGILLLLCITPVLFTACRIGPQQANTTTFVSELKSEVGYFAGSPMTGHTSVDPNSLHAEESLAVTMSWLVIKQLPKNLLDPAESQIRLIKIFPSQKPVSPIAQLTRGTRIGSIENTEWFINRITNDGSNGGVFLGKLYGVLPQRITTSFRIAEKNPTDLRSPEGFEIQIFNRSQTGGGNTEEHSVKSSLEIAIVASGKFKHSTATTQESVQSSEDEDEDSDLKGEDVKITETVFLKARPFKERAQFAIILSSPFSTEEAKAFAITIDVRSPPKEGRVGVTMHALYFNQCLEYLARGTIQGRGVYGKPHDTEWSGLEDAIQSLQSPINERRALLHLAQQTNAPLVKDIALSGTEIVVGQLSQAVTNEYMSGSVTNSEMVGWMLERTAYSLLANLLSTDQATPELEAVLVRHTGQVGRHASTIEELIAGTNSIEELQGYAVRENFIYLEDISPAARTRAFEWLLSKGEAPDGYDPLAPLKERRAVLNRVEKGFD